MWQSKCSRQMRLCMFSKHENFPCVIIEALSCGLPVVASNVGGIAEAVNETNGILVEANNMDALQNAILSMMNNINIYDSATNFCRSFFKI